MFVQNLLNSLFPLLIRKLMEFKNNEANTKSQINAIMK